MQPMTTPAMNVLANAQTVPLARLNEAMPAELRPVESLYQALRDESSTVAWTRISAFSRYATSPEDLVEWIDNVPEDTLEGYRSRFRLFLTSLARAEKCYACLRRPGPRDTAFVLEAGAAAGLAAALSEEGDADVFIPKRGVALLGDNDFGCTLAYVGRGDREWVERCASEAGLYSVSPP